ncbi:hypothetical protein SUGI_0570860 [Cryptomeria japonica]|nr:hypothetical protein SUGI_0570860 [Cryptomeria japonica]
MPKLRLDNISGALSARQMCKSSLLQGTQQVVSQPSICLCKALLPETGRQPAVPVSTLEKPVSEGCQALGIAFFTFSKYLLKISAQ